MSTGWKSAVVIFHDCIPIPSPGFCLPGFLYLHTRATHNMCDLVAGPWIKISTKVALQDIYEALGVKPDRCPDAENLMLSCCSGPKGAVCMLGSGHVQVTIAGSLSKLSRRAICGKMCWRGILSWFFPSTWRLFRQKICVCNTLLIKRRTPYLVLVRRGHRAPIQEIVRPLAPQGLHGEGPTIPWSTDSTQCFGERDEMSWHGDPIGACSCGTRSCRRKCLQPLWAA